MQQSPGPRKQFVLARHVHRPDVADVLIVEVGLDLLPEICLILDDPRDEQRQPAQTSNLDRQMDTFVRVDPAEENQSSPPRFLKRVQREIDAVVDGRQVIQPCGSIGVADGDKISVAILLIDRHDLG